MIAALIIIFIALACCYQWRAYRRMYNYVLCQLNRPLSGYCPKAAVILPCKGLDHDFKDNLCKLVTQNYGQTNPIPGTNTAPHFEIIFAVATEDDPAYPSLKQVIEENPNIKSKLIVAGIDNRRAQKITNQLAALKHISPDVEVLVFVDSDVIAGTDFLAQLVSPLQDVQIGITTGYRFYLPSKFSLPALMRSLWNRISAWELSSRKFSFAWGGAMAIRRQVFEQTQIAQVWDKAADDDLSMTTAVKRVGLSVHFVPQCLVVSHGDAPWSEILEWTNRQLILTKVYYPQLWYMAVIRAAVMAIWLFVVVVLSFYIVISHVFTLLPILLATSSLLLVELYFLFQAHGLWGKLLRQDDPNNGQRNVAFDVAYKNLLWQSAIALPIAHLILPLLTLYSVFTNRIRWRGINYELRSPEETLVI